MFGQWTKPEPAKVQDISVNKSALFLYNKGAGAFYTGGNEYGTRASIGTEADSVRFELIADDNYNFCDYPRTKDKWLWLSCNNFDAMWVDGSSASSTSTYPNTDAWSITSNNDGTYRIVNKGYDANYELGVAETFNGRYGNTRLYIHDTEQMYAVNEYDMLPSFGGEFYADWCFIDGEEYETLQPKVELYFAAQQLNAAIKNAKIDVPGYDFTSVEKVYNNTSSTLDELKEAKSKIDAVASFMVAYNKAMENHPTVDLSALKAICDNAASTAEEIAAAEKEITVEVNKQIAKGASLSTPVDFTSLIGDGSSTKNWSFDFKGVSTYGTSATNTSAASDGITDMTAPFCETYISSANYLSDQFITQKVSALPAGLYKFSANVRLFNERTKITLFKTAKMFCDKDTIALQDYGTVSYSGNKTILWNKDHFSVIAIVKESGDVVIGFDVHATNYNWLAFNQTTLTYYGNDDVENNAYKLFKQTIKLETLKEMDANPSLIEEYNQAVGEYEATTDLKSAKAAIAKVSAAQVALVENINAYEKLMDKFDTWEKYVGEKEDLDGEYWNAFTDFVQSEDVVEGYPTPNPSFIKDGDRSLTTAEIDAYIKQVEELYAYAVAHSLQEGSDCTDMLTNPSFENGFTGWTKNAGTAGGLKAFPCVERFGGPVEIYQVVNDVTDGLYSISCKAFERPGENGSYDENTPSSVYLFMNDFQTPVQNIMEDAITPDKAVNYQNSFIEGSVGEDYTDTSGTTNNDALVTKSTGEEVYVPNGMSGASYAFRAGRYNQKVYGFVDNGQMKIGLTSNGKDAHWVLWSDFHLTYEGRSESVLKEALPAMADQLLAYTENNELTGPAIAAAEKAVREAQNKIGADADQMYEQLKALNQATKDAHTNANTVKEFNEAWELLEKASDATDEEGLAAYEAILSDVFSYEERTTAQLLNLIERMYETLGKMMPSSGTETLATPSADKEVVTGVCYTTGLNGEITASTKNGYLKMRTGNADNTLTFKVNNHYRIIGLKIEGYSNNTSTTADRSIDLIGMYVDDSEESLIDEIFTFNGGTATQNPTTFEKDGFNATKNIVLKFDNSKITSDDSKGKNKQIMAKVTFTYQLNTQPSAIQETVIVPVNSIDGMYNLNGQRIITPQAHGVYIKSGKKYVK